MKLSQLEALVAAMRQQANERGIKDPNITFWEANRAELLDACKSDQAFIDMDMENSSPDDLHLNRVTHTGNGQEIGDYNFPLRVIKKN